MSVKPQAHINPSVAQFREGSRKTPVDSMKTFRTARGNRGVKNPEELFPTSQGQPWSCVRMNNFDIDRSHSKSKGKSYSTRCPQRLNTVSYNSPSTQGTIPSGSSGSPRGPDLESSFYQKISIHDKLQLLSPSNHSPDDVEDDSSTISGDSFACDENTDLDDTVVSDELKPSSCIVDFADFSHLDVQTPIKEQRSEQKPQRQESYRSLSRSSSRRYIACRNSITGGSGLRRPISTRRIKQKEDVDPLGWYHQTRSDGVSSDAQRHMSSGSRPDDKVACRDKPTYSRRSSKRLDATSHGEDQRVC